MRVQRVLDGERVELEDLCDAVQLVRVWLVQSEPDEVSLVLSASRIAPRLSRPTSRGTREPSRYKAQSTIMPLRLDL